MPESIGYDRDHDRPLASSGIVDAKKMGIFLSDKNELPDLVISSTANRAKTTVKTAMKEGKWPCPLVLERGIYGGSPPFLLKLAREQNDKLSCICLVGHEPNFSNFISQSTDDVYQLFPKASMAKINFNVMSWKDITMGCGNLNWLVKPDEF